MDLIFECLKTDRLCGLVVTVPGYRSRGPGSIAGSHIFLDVVDLEGIHSASWVQLRSYLKEKSSGSGLKKRDQGRRGSVALTTRQPSMHQKLALTSPTNGGRSVSIVRSLSQATEFVLFK
jgi:hypothetical protein